MQNYTIITVFKPRWWIKRLYSSRSRRTIQLIEFYSEKFVQLLSEIKEKQKNKTATKHEQTCFYDFPIMKTKSLGYLPQWKTVWALRGKNKQTNKQNAEPRVRWESVKNRNQKEAEDFLSPPPTPFLHALKWSPWFCRASHAWDRHPGQGGRCSDRWGGGGGREGIRPLRREEGFKPDWRHGRERERLSLCHQGPPPVFQRSPHQAISPETCLRQTVEGVKIWCPCGCKHSANEFSNPEFSSCCRLIPSKSRAALRQFLTPVHLQFQWRIWIQMSAFKYCTY